MKIDHNRDYKYDMFDCICPFCGARQEDMFERQIEDSIEKLNVMNAKKYF